MSNKNTVKLKELIFNVLDNDITLRNLLGGSDKIRHMQPNQKSEYPCVVYSFITEVGNEYNTDIADCDIKLTRLAIQVFSSEISSKEVSNIDDRIYEILHGQNISDSNIKVFTCLWVSSVPFFEADIGIWRIETRYNLVNISK